MSVGADEPVAYSVKAGPLPTLFSQGVTVTYSAVDTNADGRADTLQASAGTRDIFTLPIDQSSGGYTYTLQDQLDHTGSLASGTGDSQILTLDLSGSLVATDKDGDPLTIDASSLIITVEDDLPIAYDEDSLILAEGGVTIGSSGAGANLLNNDIPGADAPLRITKINFTPEGGDPAELLSEKIIPVGGSVLVDTIYGNLTVWSTGEWSYTSDPTENHSNADPLYEAFTYTVVDTDGDTATARQMLGIQDTAPYLGTPDNNIVYEKNLPTGSEPAPLLLTKTGSLSVFITADTIHVTFNDPTPPILPFNTPLSSGGNPVQYDSSVPYFLAASLTNGGGTFLLLRL